jgi:hypothetical protein
VICYSEKGGIDWGEEKPWQDKWNKPPRERKVQQQKQSDEPTPAPLEPALGREAAIKAAYQKYVDQPHAPKCEFQPDHSIFLGSSFSGEPRYSNRDRDPKTLPPRKFSGDFKMKNAQPEKHLSSTCRLCCIAEYLKQRRSPRGDSNEKQKRNLRP